MFLVRIAPYGLFLGLIVVPIDLIWGRNGQSVTDFVQWWCWFVGVKDTAAIQTAIGVFAGASLLCAIYFIWIFLFVLITALDANRK